MAAIQGASDLGIGSRKCQLSPAFDSAGKLGK